MRYAAGQKEKTRAKILEAAARVFRRDGYHASGIDKVMEEAGLTAGGFYAHFASKEALLAEAITLAGGDVRSGHAKALEGLVGDEWVEGFLKRYLSLTHRDKPELGCPLAALLSEAARAGDTVKRSVEGGVGRLEAALASNASRDGSPPPEDRALAAIALCVGGLGLARSVTDEALAERIIDSCREAAMTVLRG